MCPRSASTSDRSILRAELGRGASGRTYLATEPTLADRPVVLKVISDDQEEHLSLARLQHTNIIPLFSEHSFPERRLRALCMPYLGGTSLSRILEALAPIPPADRRGRDIIHVLDRVQAAGTDAGAVDGPYRRNLENASYVEAICWIGTRLADALQEAHAHGLVHMDVKPSNVLIAADGSPMLLDFHLACRPLRAGERFPGRIGGTPGWMAPEQRAALDAVVAGEPIPEPVDHRADIYALGLLLREALGGGPGPRAAAARCAAINPEVSVGLAGHPRPLPGHPARRPIPDRRRAGRRPPPSPGTPAAPRRAEPEPARALAEVAAAASRRRWASGRSGSRRRAWRRSSPADGAGSSSHERRPGPTCRRAAMLCNAEPIRGRRVPAAPGASSGAEVSPVQGRLAAELRAQLRVAHRGQQADVLHQLAEQVRFRYGIDPPAGARGRGVPADASGPSGTIATLLLARESAPLPPARRGSGPRRPARAGRDLGRGPDPARRAGGGSLAQQEALTILERGPLRLRPELHHRPPPPLPGRAAGPDPASAR